MPLDPSFVGRVYPPTEPYEVGREKIREFADALGDQNPVYRDADAARALGYPDVIAPPTFAIGMSMRAGAQVVTDPALGLDYSKVVHGEQSFDYTRPIQAGDVLQVTVSVESVRTVAGNDMVITRGDITTADGEIVVTTFSTLVARGNGGRLMVRFADVAVGSALPPQTFELERADLVRYAGASGDFNPIHWSAETAQEVGLPGVIAHGMLTMGVAVRVVTDWIGDPGALVSYGVRFTRPVPVNHGEVTELTVTGTVRSLNEVDSTAVVDLSATVGGQTVLAKARVTVRLAG